MDENQLPPGWKETKALEGKSEHDPVFDKKVMSPIWPRVGLPQFKTIVGSKHAWCGLAAAFALILAGLSSEIPKGAAGAKNWDKFGVAIDWKKNGIPQGAWVRLNHKGLCDSGKGNHITRANGDCTAADVLKSGATFDGFGGNQGDKWKVSTYSVKEICSVRWPKSVALPAKVAKSKACTSKKSTPESTR